MPIIEKNMNTFNLLITILCAIILFIYSLKGFSQELELLASDSLRDRLAKLTQNRFSGFAIGAIFTAIIQSSSAVSSMAVALINSGVLPFKNSLAILFGTNVGTTTTAWIASFDLQYLGPIFIILGFLIGGIPHKIYLIGKAIFYFGFIFFSLNLIGNALSSVKNNPQILEVIRSVEGNLEGIAVGLVVTALVQSSSVVSGLCILLVSQQIVSMETAIAIIIGANVGTTSTALIASSNFSKPAKMGAMANFLFNLTGTFVFFPFIGLFSGFVQNVMPAPAQQLALAHLCFNLITSCLFLIFLTPFYRLLCSLYSYEELETNSL
jgi:phosphate:Na+ symporter